MVVARSVFALGDAEDVCIHAAGAVPAAVHDVAFQLAHKSNFSALPCVLHPLGKYSFIPSAEPSYRRKIAVKIAVRPKDIVVQSSFTRYGFSALYHRKIVVTHDSWSRRF